MREEQREESKAKNQVWETPSTGEEEVEPLKEAVKEWPFILLPNMRFPHSVSSLRGSGSFISGGVRGQQEFKRVILGGR